MMGDEALVAGLSQLSRDGDTDVRREAMLALMSIARAHNRPMDLAQALADKQPSVMAAALQVAWAQEHAAIIASSIGVLPSELKPEAADALARIKAPETAAALLPLLKGDVAARVAAVRAYGECAKAGQHEPMQAILQDAHPTVRRAAISAIGKLAPPATRDPLAIRMLADSDPTVREAAARVLTPLPSTEALAAMLSQLDVEYAPLHVATRAALTHPANDSVRQAVIAAAAEMLAHANPLRREDASYILGRLRSDAAIDRHVALLTWDPASPEKSQWPVIAQAAESVGLIGDRRAIGPLMIIVKVAPDALAGAERSQMNAMASAMANALVAAARLRHRPAIEQSVRILALNSEGCPADLRAAAAFAIGVLSEGGTAPPADVNFFAIYSNPYEGHAAKIEVIKAVGNMRHAASADRLKELSVADGTRDLRWLAHWSYQRCANTHVPYTPPTERREPPVTIFDLSKAEH
jgi:HEAT repeat protein